MKRRTFVKSTTAGAALAAAATSAAVTGCAAPGKPAAADARGGHEFNSSYTGEFLNRVAFPMGGIGAGMVCLEGTGTLSHVSLRHEPQIFNEPLIFNAVYINDGRESVARVLEGPVPAWKVFGSRGTGNGAAGTSYGLPRFAEASFSTRFPFGTVSLSDKSLPLEVEITGWSPFVPGSPDKSSLPLAGLEFTFSNTGGRKLDAVYSFNTINFMRARGRLHYNSEEKSGQHVDSAAGGFMLAQDGSGEEPWREGYFIAATDDPSVKVNHRWFRGGWWDPLTIAWKNVEEGAMPENPPVTSGGPSPGASLFVPFSLGAGETKTVRLMLSWYVPQSHIRLGSEVECSPEKSAVGNYAPWYASRFNSANELAAWWMDRYGVLREETKKFSDTFYDTTLPAEVVEAVSANLTILKSPTTLRQSDGKLWCWEGCGDEGGCCHGSCTHVWNYAQAICHLFPSLERSLRHTEFFYSQADSGHQKFRSALPVRCCDHDFHAASDGQLGGIMKAYREWRISGKSAWLKSYWPRVKQSLDYCIETWDPRHTGLLEEPHHNTYDIEFWGPEGMCGSFYLGALRAGVLMGEALGEDVSLYRSLYEKGRDRLETELFDGEYFVQKIQTEGLRAADPVAESAKSWTSEYSDEALELLRQEGPKYQYGAGCLSDGVLGAWIAEVCGVGEIMDQEKVASHLLAIHKYNFRKDLSTHANPQRPSYAVAGEAGLLLCSWPKGGMLSLPFVYSNEVWTGIEYQVASHLMFAGHVQEALEIVRAVRGRYDGQVRNPFNEYECGHWYARAMASYGLIQGLSGARYDAVEKVLYLKPRIGGDFRSFLSTATGYGTVGVRNGEPFVEVVQGKIDVERVEYEAFA